MFEVELSHDTEQTDHLFENVSDHIEKYKQTVRTFYESVISMESQKWTTLSQRTRINCFINDVGFLKCEALLYCNAHKLYRLCSDVSYVTRRQWDTLSHMGNLRVLEEYENELRYVHFFTTDRFWHRDFLGIFWTRRTDMKIVFQTTPHPKFRHHPSRYKADCSCFISIENLDDERSFIKMVVKLDLHALWANTITAENLMDYMKLLEDTARNMRDIYDQWKCTICLKMLPAHELECRHCSKERYWRCPEMTCMQAQWKGDEKCFDCGSQKPEQ
jgi:hypothetical protein